MIVSLLVNSVTHTGNVFRKEAGASDADIAKKLVKLSLVGVGMEMTQEDPVELFPKVWSIPVVGGETLAVVAFHERTRISRIGSWGNLLYFLQKQFPKGRYFPGYACILISAGLFLDVSFPITSGFYYSGPNTIDLFPFELVASTMMPGDPVIKCSCHEVYLLLGNEKNPRQDYIGKTDVPEELKDLFRTFYSDYRVNPADLDCVFQVNRSHISILPNNSNASDA